MEFDKLGHFPILQFFGGLLVFGLGAYAVIRGFFDKRKSDNQPAPPPPHEQRWFFDGPLIEALRYLREGAKAQEQSARELRTIGDEIKENNRLLEEVRRCLDILPSVRRRRQD